MANQVHTATVLPNQVRLASACADLARAEANLEEKERPWGAQARSGSEPDGGWQNWVAEV